MDVNKTLALSLNQDILNLDKLIHEISSSYDNIVIQSWIFPIDFVPNSSNDQISSSDLYELCLEVTIDRLYALVNVFISYINNSSAKKLSTSTLISAPRKLTLGTSVQTLWRKIMELTEKQETNRKPMTIVCGNRTYEHKDTQTEIITLSTCDSCSSAIQCMKRILKTFDEQHEKITIKYQIFDITQFGCMLKVVSSIEEALSKLYKRLQEKTSENCTLKQENENSNSKLQENVSRITFLEEEVNILREQRLKDSENLVKLRQELNESYHSQTTYKTQMNTSREIITKLNGTIQSLTKENKVNKTENVKLKFNLRRSLCLLSKFNTNLYEKIIKTEEECGIIQSILQQYESSITNVIMRLIKLTKSAGKVQLTMKSNMEKTNEIWQSFLGYETFCEKIKEHFKEKFSAANENNKNSSEAVFVKGNPMEDIAKQIEVNKTKINDLEKENEKLEKLLSRFKQMKIAK